jgi:HD superfamily phosphohydrolase YqeK
MKGIVERGKIVENYFDFKPSGELGSDIREYFLKYGRQDTYEHTLDVIEELYTIKDLFGCIESGSEIACYCHDLGRVVRDSEVIAFCIEYSIKFSEEEKEFPSILHQRISCFIVERVFGIKDESILDAINYHTTSRRNPSMTEMEVFLADKMSWKEDEYKEISRAMKEQLQHSKEKAIFYYLSNLENNKENLKLYHPDSKEAYAYFKQICTV